MATDSFQLSPASVEERFQLLQLRAAFNPEADDPLFRPIDADDFRTNGDSASDFSNLRQNGSSGSSFPLPPNMRLIDPATGAPSAERSSTCGARCRPSTTWRSPGPDWCNPWFARPEPVRRLSARCARRDAAGTGARRADEPRRRSSMRRRSGCWTIWPSFQRVLFTQSRVRALSDAVARGAMPLPDPTAAQRTRAAGQSGVRPRLHAVSWRPGPVDAHSRRFPASTTSHAVPAAGRHRRRRRAGFTACPPRLARNARTYEITLVNGATDPPHELRSRSRAVDRFVGGPAPPDDWNKLDVPRLRGLRTPRRTSTTTAPPRSRRSSITTSSSSSS